jgi:hypothetical protein
VPWEDHSQSKGSPLDVGRWQHISSMAGKAQDKMSGIMKSRIASRDNSRIYDVLMMTHDRSGSVERSVMSRMFYIAGICELRAASCPLILLKIHDVMR